MMGEEEGRNMGEWGIRNEEWRRMGGGGGHTRLQQRQVAAKRLHG